MDRVEYLQAKEFIYTDIQKEINLAKASENIIKKIILKIIIKYPGGANFMSALSLLCYTEAAGKIITQKDTPQVNFEIFFKLLGIEYENFLQKHPKTYNIFRCGLAHEYYVKKNCPIYMLSDILTCGIGQDSNNKYFFVVEHYFRDFKNAFDKLLGNHVEISGPVNSIGATSLSVQRY